MVFVIQSSTGADVLVMELCTGGSLFNLLDDPENTYGIEEKEFKQVLSDVGRLPLHNSHACATCSHIWFFTIVCCRLVCRRSKNTEARHSFYDTSRALSYSE